MERRASHLHEGGIPFVSSIFHPTDFSASSRLAFGHALAIALMRRTRLDILHVGAESNGDWSRFPGVRQTLERWGVLEPGSDRSAVFDELSVRVRKMSSRGDPVQRSLEYVGRHDPDMIVLATEGRDGLARWREPSKGQEIARRSRALCLLVPAGARGFVSLETGTLSLSRILVPVAERPDAHAALVYATRAAELLGDPPVEIELLHVGGGRPPSLERPDGEAHAWLETRTDGDVVAEIVSASKRADLVVMPTEGRDSFVDTIRGSHVERVVRGVDCPLLAVPSA